MDSYKNERSYSDNGGGYYNNHASPQRHYNNNKRYRAGSSPTPHPNQNATREKGVIEKLLNSYGFLECAATSSRVFFHYSEFDGDPNSISVGDCMEFTLTTDPRNNKLLAVKLSTLPTGSVVLETLAEEECFGRVEVEPKIQRNVDIPDVTTLGRVSYDKAGEYFFLPYAMGDIEEGSQAIHKGDSVSFYVATNKRTGSLKARKVKYSKSTAAVKVIQGIVSSLKESFGFIERGDIVEEIFFHYSEYNGSVNELIIGDDVEFQLQQRAGKEIAIDVHKLPSGTVVFEDISQTRFKGHVIKANSTATINGKVDGHLTGLIEYQGKKDSYEVMFGDRDAEDDIVLQKGDVVEFNVSTDRRDKLQRAVNIKLLSVNVLNGEAREMGVISGLKDGFGFIRCADRPISIFFHYSEVLEQSRVMNMNDEVEFEIQDDPISQRQHATRVRFLPKGSVSFETVSTTRYTGRVEKESVTRSNSKSPIKLHKEQEQGVIMADINGQTCEVGYHFRDCNLRNMPHYHDKVDFNLVTKKQTGLMYAKDINIVEKCSTVFKTGFVCTLKENFGFIELDDHTRELFFHYSAVTDNVELELGDRVKFCETRTNSDKLGAVQITKVVGGLQNEVLSAIYDGTVVRPVRNNQTEQVEYEGLIEVTGECESNEERESTYAFSITSLADKNELLQPGDKVTFQLCVDYVTKSKRAHNVTCKRNVLRGRIESIKGGQFGFISYEGSEDGKSVFFHMTEVVDKHAVTLKSGDDVSFVLNHKNSKKSAVRVQKIVNERPEHLTRRRSKHFSESSNGFIAIRTPTGPDGTKGFKLSRLPSNPDELKIAEINLLMN